MTPSRPVVLAPLLLAVLDGCFFDCGGLVREDGFEVVEVSLDDLEAASDAFGELTPDGCQVLCEGLEALAWVEKLERIHSCDLVSETPPVAEISCSFTAQVHESCRGGRAHVSIHPSGPLLARGPLSAWLVRSAWEEAASVGAFRRLARELAGHGAPASLVARARSAARDEIRHARMLRALVGVHVPSARFEPDRERTLFAMALENTVEGCVRETHAALVAHHQARHALAPLRPVFARIARDETLHGQWSWDVDAWVRPRLTADQRAELDVARGRALAGLRDVPAPDPAVRRVFGVPGAEVGRRLASGLGAALA